MTATNVPSASPAVVEPGRPIVGAIRWDGWHGEFSSVGLILEQTLAPQHWHYRLPFFARELSEGEVQVRGNTQAVLDQEIAFAAQAGLDYWAFVIYPPDNALSAGLHLYLSSAHKARINFCLNLQGGWLGSEAGWPKQVERYVNYFKEPTYQTVLGNRPLVYLYSAPDMLGAGKFGSEAFAREAFDRLRAASRQAGTGDPYLVVQDWSPATAHRFVELLGGQAVSAYASDAHVPAGSFTTLATHTQAWWDTFAATGSAVVPLVTAGWDPRPRIETPTPWFDYGSADYYHAAPTPPELAQHVQAGLDWLSAHPTTAPANAVLIYAWNEFDEGGWLAPTLAEGAARLEAIETVLSQRPAIGQATHSQGPTQV